MAEQVLRMPTPSAQSGYATGGARPPPCEADASRSVFRKAVESAPGIADGFTAGLGPGRPLDASAREFFEPRFGADLGGVRVHTGPEASAAAREVRALAFTVGRDVVFGAEQYHPESNDGRRLLAHELTHVMQQGSRAPTPRIQRTDWGLLGGTCCNSSREGDEWALVGSGVWQRLSSGHCTGTTTDCDGMTCGGGFYYVSNLETGNCRTPRHDDATFRDRRWTPGRPRSDARSPVQRGSAQGNLPPGYAYDQEIFQIEHQSGSVYDVPGLTAGEAEFGASGVTSALTAPATRRRADQPVTGGFPEDLAVDTAFGTGVETAAAREADALIRAAGDRVDARLAAAIRAVASDRFVLVALRTFLETDHGRLEAWDNDRGHYDGDQLPPTISIGISGGALDTRTTLVHELLHYVFDRTDSVLGEARDAGGADHPAIRAIEARFLIIDLIRSGQAPLHEKLESDFGRFLRLRDFFPLMQQAIAQNDPAALVRAVDSTEFVTATVSSGLLGPAGALTFPAAPDRYRYTADQLRDLAFVWAQNAVIVRRAMKTAARISTRTGTPLREVFSRADWRSEMESFLSRFVRELRRDRTRGVVSLEARL